MGVRFAKDCRRFGGFGVDFLEDRPGGWLADMEVVAIYLFEIDECDGSGWAQPMLGRAHEVAVHVVVTNKEACATICGCAHHWRTKFNRSAE